MGTLGSYDGLLLYRILIWRDEFGRGADDVI